MVKILIDYIKQNGLEALNKNFSIDIKRHKKYPSLILLKYSQIESPMKEPVVQICRGILLDENDFYRAVCWSYNKFFNVSEPLAAKIDWNSAKVYIKEDGSLCQLYHYQGSWHVATSGTPDASGNVGDFGFTFEELFWKTWSDLGYQLPKDTDYSFSFELCSKYNRVVCRQEKERIVLHGARNLTTMVEQDPVIVARNNNWECVKTFPFKSIEEVLEASKKLDPMQQEGFVVVDQNFSRVKIKSEQYVAMSHLRDSVGQSKRQLLEIVRKGEGTEFLSYFPEFQDTYNEIKSKYDALVEQIDQAYNEIKNIESQKEFASFAVKCKFSGLLFSFRSKKIGSFKQGLAEINIRALENWIRIKSVEV